MGDPRETRNLSDVSVVEFSIHGRGEIGDKARQLMEKQAMLRAAGFRTPPRVVLAEDFFDAFFRGIDSRTRTLSDSEGVPHISEKTVNGDLTQTEDNVLADIRRGFKQTHPAAPLMVRSSAKGDARGTGIYSSYVRPNTKEAVDDGVKRVVASYFSDSATAFRRDANTGTGFGVIIEPMVGQPLQENVSEFRGGTWTEKTIDEYAPVLSGIAYTSTSRGEGYITVVSGFGGGVDRRGSEKLTRSIVEHTEESRNNRIVMNTRGFREESMTDIYRGQGLLRFIYDSSQGGRLVIPDEAKEALHPDMFLQLFDKLDVLQELTGKPQYLEWAMTMDGATPTFWAVQIADVDKKIDVFEASDRYSTTMFSAREVTGSGVVDAEKIVICSRSEQISSLERFNSENEGYVLVYFEDLTSNNIFNTGRRLGYSHLSNAKVVLEMPGGMGHYDAPPISHFGGMIESTGKIFGVLGERTTHDDGWNEFHFGSQRVDGLEVYDGKIKVIADERKNKLEVTVDPKPRPDYDSDYELDADLDF